MKKWLLFVFSLIFVSISCSQSRVIPFEKDITTFKSGQNFGFCMGKCYNELIITNNKLMLLQKEISYPGIIKNHEFDESDNFKTLTQTISGFNLNNFLALDDVYGCPDCADGGSEWIEITLKNGKTKRTTFEYGTLIPGFEKIIKNLNAERQTLIEKHK